MQTMGVEGGHLYWYGFTGLLATGRYLLAPFRLATAPAFNLLVNPPHASTNLTAVSGSLSSRTGGARN